MTGKEISRRTFILSSLCCIGSLKYLSIESKLNKYRLSETRQTPLKELDINNNVSEILSLTPKMSFDREGNLTYLKDSQIEKVALLQTDHDLKRTQSDSEKMQHVSLMVHHFDDATVSNSYTDRRTAATTVNGLNNPYGFPEGASTPTVHWCIDSYPINTKGTTETGYGILQTQKGSGDVNHPNHGQHVTI
jgi:hypothetical protein